MRNTYTLFDYGNFMEDTANDRGDPFIQLLSVTDATEARQDFVQLRLNGVDTTNDTAHALLPTSQMQHSPISEAEKKKQYVVTSDVFPYLADEPQLRAGTRK